MPDERTAVQQSAASAEQSAVSKQSMSERTEPPYNEGVDKGCLTWPSRSRNGQTDAKLILIEGTYKLKK